MRLKRSDTNRIASILPASDYPADCKRNIRTGWRRFGPKSLDNGADEVVFVGFGDLDVVDLADLGVEVVGHVIDEDVALDLVGSY